MENANAQSTSLSPAYITPARYDNEKQLLWGGVYDGEGNRIDRLMRPNFGSWKHADQERISIDELKCEVIAEAAYAGRFFVHFGHFLLETLPHLYAASKSHQLLLCHPWPAIPHEYIGLNYRSFLLGAISVSPDRIRLADRPLQVATLLAPHLCTPPMLGKVSADHVQTFAAIRTAALAGYDGHLPRLVYLSRRQFQGGSNRNVSNEEDVEGIFQRHGFQIISPEKLTIQEQVRLAATAEVVAGVDGSAMHLSSFMTAGSTCIILESRRQASIEAINTALQVRTERWQICSSAFSAGKQDVAIDTAELLKKLNALGSRIKLP